MAKTKKSRMSPPIDKTPPKFVTYGDLINGNAFIIVSKKLLTLMPEMLVIVCVMLLLSLSTSLSPGKRNKHTIISMDVIV